MLIHTQPATLKSKFREVFDNYEDIFTLVNVLYIVPCWFSVLYSRTASTYTIEDQHRNGTTMDKAYSPTFLSKTMKIGVFFNIKDTSTKSIKSFLSGVGHKFLMGLICNPVQNIGRLKFFDIHEVKKSPLLPT